MLVQKGYTAQEWKVNSGKIEVIPFVVKSSCKLSIANVEIAIQVWGGSCNLRCFLYFKFTWIDEFQIFCKFCVFQRQYIIYIYVGEIELLCKVFLACFEETLYKLRLIRVWKQVGKQRCTASTHPIVCWNIRPPNSTKYCRLHISASFWYLHLRIFVVH